LITITVSSLPPVLTSPGNKGVTENYLLTFTLSAIDPDLDVITYSATGLPVGASLITATGVFSWTPNFTQSGTYNVIFTATSDNQSDSKLITITVNDVDRSPVLISPGDKIVNEYQLLTFTLSAADPEGHTITYSMAGTPTGATLNTTTGVFNWTPNGTQSGSYSDIGFRATATCGLFSEKAITITVSDVLISSQVTSPTPADGATDVITTTQLSWAPASGAVSYDVYFGTTTTGWSPVINTTGTVYNQGIFNCNIIYYWRVDSKNPVGTTTGNIWSFSNQVIAEDEDTPDSDTTGSSGGRKGGGGKCGSIGLDILILFSPFFILRWWLWRRARRKR
ncbi:MAG: putative Ig domain-containing protein, partial [Planctomycetota bacterium]